MKHSDKIDKMLEEKFASELEAAFLKHYSVPCHVSTNDLTGKIQIAFLKDHRLTLEQCDYVKAYALAWDTATAAAIEAVK